MDGETTMRIKLSWLVLGYGCIYNSGPGDIFTLNSDEIPSSYLLMDSASASARYGLIYVRLPYLITDSRYPSEMDSYTFARSLFAGIGEFHQYLNTIR